MRNCRKKSFILDLYVTQYKHMQKHHDGMLASANKLSHPHSGSCVCECALASPKNACGVFNKTIKQKGYSLALLHTLSVNGQNKQNEKLQKTNP